MTTYKEQQKAKYLFRDYFNNFLTVGAFASWYGMSEKEALITIELGKEVHNKQAEFLKGLGQ